MFERHRTKSGNVLLQYFRFQLREKKSGRFYHFMCIVENVLLYNNGHFYEYLHLAFHSELETSAANETMSTLYLLNDIS